jgi:hypothetical protein
MAVPFRFFSPLPSSSRVAAAAGNRPPGTFGRTGAPIETGDARRSPAALLQLGRRLRSVAWMARSVLLHPSPRYLLQYDGGIGDSLLCSAICRELRRRGSRGLWMATRHSELFRLSPDVDHVVEPAVRVNSFVRWMGGKLVDPHYARYDSQTDRHVYQAGHQIAVMCAAAGITGPIALRPYVYLSEAERAAGRLAEGQVVIHSSGAAARYAIPNKEWFPERFAQVSTELSRRFPVVQIGSATDPLLPGVRDLRGKTSLRETAAILSQARVFVGLEGFLMHLARAVECRAVIVYGGHSNPAQLGYSANCNLYTPLPCAPCGQRSTCARERECMRAISPEAVLAGVERQLERYGTALPEDEAVLN